MEIKQMVGVAMYSPLTGLKIKLLARIDRHKVREGRGLHYCKHTHFPQYSDVFIITCTAIDASDDEIIRYNLDGATGSENGYIIAKISSRTHYKGSIDFDKLGIKTLANRPIRF